MITIKLEASVLSDPAVCEAFVALIQQLSPHGAALEDSQGGALVTFEGPAGSKVFLKTSSVELLEAARRQAGLKSVLPGPNEPVDKRARRAQRAQTQDKQTQDRGAQDKRRQRRKLKQRELEDWIQSLPAHKSRFVQALRQQGQLSYERAYELLDVPQEQRTLKRLNGILGTIARWSGPSGDKIIVPWESDAGAYHWRAELIEEP